MADTQPKSRMSARLIWFVGLWAGGVALMVLIGAAIKLALGH